MATNSSAALSNVVEKATGISVNVASLNEPTENDYLKLLEMDNAAQAEVDGWIKQNNEFKQQGAGLSEVTLNARIEKRFEPVKKAYEDFLQRNPKHARARLAYGSFLNDIHEEDEALLQWEKAREADPHNPAAWNNLANYHGHNGPVAKSFAYYAKAIEPKEPSDTDPPDVHAKWNDWREHMERITGLSELIIAKQRHGATGKVRLRFEARITKFSDLAPDDMRAAYESD